MIKKYISVVIIFAFLILTFSSCISFKRDIRLNKDGSGSESMKITFHKAFYEIMSSMTSFMDDSRREGYLDSLFNNDLILNETKSKFDSLSGINLTGYFSEKNPDSSNSFTIKYDFDSVYKIGSSSFSALKSGSEELPAAKVFFDNSDKSNIIFRYEYSNDMKGFSDSGKADSLSEQMLRNMADMFEGGMLELTVTFPYEIISSNSDSSSGNTLYWKNSIKESMLNKKMILEAVMKEN